jgi:hypothetical protein
VPSGAGRRDSGVLQHWIAQRSTAGGAAGSAASLTLPGWLVAGSGGAATGGPPCVALTPGPGIDGYAEHEHTSTRTDHFTQLP